MNPPAASGARVIVFGIMVFYPLAGVRYQFLHYLRGLRKLGYDVYYVEDTPYHVWDPVLGDFTFDTGRNVALLADYMKAEGLADRWAFRGYDEKIHGMSEPALLELFRTADAVLNVTGGQGLKPEHMQIPRRVYVESDPFPQQVRVSRGEEKTISFLDGHTHHFSFGENLGQPDCTLPVDRYTWLPTRQPVDMDVWATDIPGGDTYTTVTTWRNKGKDIEWNGSLYYWTKDIEFRKFLDLPRRRNIQIELATTIDADVKGLLDDHGWGHRDALAVSMDAAAYRQYVRSSRTEFTVARDQYYRPRTGWFSDRSVCYLAAGRPVVTQETGFSKFVPSGAGLFAYETMDGILAAVDAIESDYAGQCRAARDVAAAYFSTDVVLSSLMRRIGL